MIAEEDQIDPGLVVFEHRLLFEHSLFEQIMLVRATISIVVEYIVKNLIWKDLVI